MPSMEEIEKQLKDGSPKVILASFLRKLFHFRINLASSIL